MKRLKFKKPFNGMDNAKKLIPESYKVDGNEFEITDGYETYRIKWSSLINEGIVLTSSNKSQINEDMQKMKHLMGFKSQDTLGAVKGVARLDENKKFGDILGKTKKLLSENNSLNEKELTPDQEEHIDKDNDGKITKNDFDIMNQNEVHIKEEEEELGALSKGEIGKKFKEYGNTISKADFKPKERIVTTQLLDIIKKLAGKSNAYSPAVIMKLEMLVKEIDKAIDSGGAAEGDEGAEDQKGFKVDEATFTDEYNDNDKLTGGQDELPDELQAAILGVDEANAIKPGTARSGMGGERGLKGSHLTKGESKGKPRNHALRQAGNDEIEKQLTDMEPKDRFEEVFEGIHEAANNGDILPPDNF